VKARSWYGYSVLVLSLAAVTAGQETGRKAELATGSVSGTVTCADTNAPARFAVVTLERVPEDQTKAGAKGSGDSGMNPTATTDLEGRFDLEKVASGRYYVLAGLAGYLNPLARFEEGQLRTMSEEMRNELAKDIPTVSVEGNQSATVSLRLERASEINGTVLYDDGSPAVGLGVSLLRKDKDGKLAQVNTAPIDEAGIFGSHGITDDHGHYRLLGAPPGEYTVSAMLPTVTVAIGGLLRGETSINTTGEEGGELVVYNGDTFRKRAAKILKVAESEQAGGVDITIHLAGLHTVRGTVTAKRDGHALNRGQVELLYADDPEDVRFVHVAENGTFELKYVPEDRYILRVTSGADTEQVEIHPYTDMTVKQDKVIRSYGEAEMPLLVQGDVNGLVLAAPDMTSPAVAQQQ
jgi:hypothetical protein